MRPELMNKGKLPLSWEECEAYRKAVFKERWNSGIKFRCMFVLMLLCTLLGYLAVSFFTVSQKLSFFVTFLLLNIVFIGFYWYVIATGIKEWREKRMISMLLGGICIFIFLILSTFTVTSNFHGASLFIQNSFVFVFLIVGPFGLVDRIRIRSLRHKYLSSLPFAPPISSGSSKCKRDLQASIKTYLYPYSIILLLTAIAAGFTRSHSEPGS